MTILAHPKQPHRIDSLLSRLFTIIMKPSLYFILTFVLCITYTSPAQTGRIHGQISSDGKPVEFASVSIPKRQAGTITDSLGIFSISDIPAGTHLVVISSIGYETFEKNITVRPAQSNELNINLRPSDQSLNEVVVTGTMKEVSRMDSPVPVEIITPRLFQKNPTPSLFEAIGMVNGVKPQLNCNVCNTGDIHINGMEGPYTMILIDGMPIVSALSTVYGLNGIPNSLVERIEVVKGPASSLYGSEAMGGIINVITKNPLKAPIVAADIFATGWGEINTDVSVKAKVNKKTTTMLGVNYFLYDTPTDKNKDGFTDITLQNRLSLFNKWNIERKDNRVASLGARYIYETRWGGEMAWTPEWRGSDSLYGESIYTKRAELIGMYQLPVAEKIMTQFSYNWHDQNSWYGTTPYKANQKVAFAQTYWDKNWRKSHNFLLGASFRYTYYDDNTPATADPSGRYNQPSKTPIPGIFVQDEWAYNTKSKLLAGYRFDYHQKHGGIHSPRIAYKYAPNNANTLRASFGTGFRVVNLFTEDHAALTGAREVIIQEELNPEQSYNGNLNYVWKLQTDPLFINVDVTGFYSYFTNKIVADFDTDPNLILYNNLRGYAISRGISLNLDLSFNFPLKLMLGTTYMNVFQNEDNADGIKEITQQLHAPKWSGTFIANYTLPRNFSVDLTGNWNGPMRLPILPNDYRPEYSPWFCIANIQVNKKFSNDIEIYGGVKNIFNFIPENPIMRAFDPFDKKVDDPINNPHGYTFDPTYNYASLQGSRVFLGIRYNFWGR